MTHKIPVVFAFDDNYALPASVAIQSLIDSRGPDTKYDVIVLHGGLKKSTMHRMETICPIRWIQVGRDAFQGAPMGWSGRETYYRLLLADLLPEYDRVIWSDVDVLFMDDLANIFEIDMHDCDWAGIIAEKRDEKNGVHQHFPENTKPYVYMPGFMIANTKLWRDKNMSERFSKIISEYGPRLKMFDLDVLNLAADKIAAIPFEYCVLENIYDADDIKDALEYPWLAAAHSPEALAHARQRPKIIHYAGRSPKIWLRRPNEIARNYFAYLVQSPFYNHEYYFPGWRTHMRRVLLWPVIKLCPVKAWRKKLKKARK